MFSALSYMVAAIYWGVMLYLAELYRFGWPIAQVTRLWHWWHPPVLPPPRGRHLTLVTMNGRHTRLGDTDHE